MVQQPTNLQLIKRITIMYICSSVSVSILSRFDTYVLWKKEQKLIDIFLSVTFVIAIHIYLPWVHLISRCCFLRPDFEVSRVGCDICAIIIAIYHSAEALPRTV